MIYDSSGTFKLKQESYKKTREHLVKRYYGSYDSFIFQSPINIVTDKLIDHVQNRAWARKMFLKLELEKIGMLNFINPCKSYCYST